MNGSENGEQRKIDAFDIEFEDISSFAPDTRNNRKQASLLRKVEEISKSTGAHLTVGTNLSPELTNVYSYEFQSDVMLKCKVENWNVGTMMFADFLQDAKKYYKKTCLNAKYVYFFSYRPVYKEMTHEQLCWYLHWRSAIRDGQYIKTGLTYIFLYLYEQINLCNIIGVEKVYKNIVDIWKNYRNEFQRIDKYIAEWLIDFSLIHNIKINLDEIEDILPDLLNIVTLPEMYLQDNCYQKQKYAELLVKNISAYDYKKSKFYADNKELFDVHILNIVHTVMSSTEFAEILKAEIKDSVKIKTTRESYSGAVCTFENKRKITIEYKNIYRSFFLKQYITDTIRLAENILRGYLGIKSRLTVSEHPDALKLHNSRQSYPKELQRLIDAYREKYLPTAKDQSSKKKSKTKSKSNKPNDEDYELPIIEFNPNVETASKIEKHSWDTTITLVELQQRDNADNKNDVNDTNDKNNADNINSINDTDNNDNSMNKKNMPHKFLGMTAIDTNDTSFEDYGDFDEIVTPESPSVSVPTPENSETGMGGFANSLTDVELDALSKLCSTKSNDNMPFEMICTEFLRVHNIMLETVIDNVNDKAVDFIGDIIFDLVLGEIVEDYADELDFFLQRRKELAQDIGGK